MNTYCILAGCDGDGSDWNKALPCLPEELERGAIYYVGAGDYVGYTFATPGDDMIRVFKATTKDHGTDMGWQNAYAAQACFDWLSFRAGGVLFDGGTGGGPFSWEKGFGFEVLCTDFSGAVVNFHNEVSNIEIRHSNIHFLNRTENCLHPVFRIIQDQSDIKLSHCWIHDAPADLLKTWGVHGLCIEYCKISDNYSDAERHGDGIESYGGSNWIIRHNWFEDVVGTYVLGCHDWGDAPSGWTVYGNLFTWTRDQGVSNGIIGTLSNSQAIHDLKVYHNTFVNLPEGVGGIILNGGGSAKSFNNIFYNCPNCYHSNVVRSDYCYYYNSPHEKEPHERKAMVKDIFKSIALKDFHLIRNIKGRKLDKAYSKDMENYTRKYWRLGALERLDKA